MFAHVMVGANNLAASRAFYDALFATLDIPAGFQDPKGRVIWNTSEGMFIITPPLDGKPATHANGGTIGFRARSPEQADAWHAAGVAHGGTSVENPPGWRDGQFSRMYLAYLRDPAGNKVCAIHRP